MIKINRGKIEIRGDETLIMSELSTLIFAIRDDEILSDKQLKRSIDAGFKSEQDIRKELADKIKKLEGDSFIDAIKELTLRTGMLDEEDFYEEEKSDKLKDLLKKLNEDNDEEE